MSFNILLLKDGYKFRFNSIENCGGKDQIVTVDSNFTSTINKKCEVTTVGCVSSKGFKDANVCINHPTVFQLQFLQFITKHFVQAKYTLYKNGMAVMSGTPDLCSEIEQHKEAKAPLEMVGFPTACPIKKVCRTKR